MKATKLTCNACRLVEEIEQQDYAPNPPKVGWFHVVVSELRPALPAPRDPMLGAMDAMESMLEEQDAPPAARKFLDTMRNSASASALEYAPPPMPSQQGADLCPTCGPKVLGSLIPHLITERARGLVGSY